MQAVAEALRQFAIEAVISSPYLRCLQTTAIILAELLPDLKTVEVDLSLGEVCLEPRIPPSAFHAPSPSSVGVDQEQNTFFTTQVFLFVSSASLYVKTN